MEYFSSRFTALQEAVIRHPYTSLGVFTVLILAASWYQKRTRKRMPAKSIDLYKYHVNTFGFYLEKMPYFVKSGICRLLWGPTVLWNLFNFYTMPLGTHDWWNKVDDTTILGCLPLYFQVEELHKLGVRGVVNTCDEYAGPWRTYEQFGIQQLHIPVVDYTAPTSDQIDKAVAFIEKFRSRGEMIYIHCKAGKGRSTTVLVCYLMKAHNLTAQQALRMIIDRRHQVSKYLWRRQCVVDFAVRNNLRTEDPLSSRSVDVTKVQ
jgi:atypical dual specificity phosphatase